MSILANEDDVLERCNITPLDWVKDNCKIIGEARLTSWINPATGCTDERVNIIGNVTINEDVKEIPIKFHMVSGEFNIKNCQIKSLIGCPDFVGDFFCDNCQNLENLIGGPIEIMHNVYMCTNCICLKSFKGAPDEIFFPIRGQHYKPLVYNFNGCPHLTHEDWENEKTRRILQYELQNKNSYDAYIKNINIKINENNFIY